MPASTWAPPCAIFTSAAATTFRSIIRKRRRRRNWPRKSCILSKKKGKGKSLTCVSQSAFIRFSAAAGRRKPYKNIKKLWQQSVLSHINANKFIQRSRMHKTSTMIFSTLQDFSVNFKPMLLNAIPKMDNKTLR